MPSKKQQPFHYWLPFNIEDHISDSACSTCETVIKRKDIIAIGVRKQDGCDRNVAFIEYKCPKCGLRAIKLLFSVQVQDIEGMCFWLLEEIHKIKKIEKSSETRKCKQSDSGKITKEELEEMSNYLKKPLPYEDFLKFIGADKLEEKL